SLRALGYPVGGKLIAGRPPDLLRVLLEEHVGEFLPELAPVGVVHVANGRIQDDPAKLLPKIRSPRVKDRDWSCVRDDVAEGDRIVEEATLMIDAADAVHRHQFTLHQAMKPGVEIGILGEPAVSAEIEAITVSLHGDAEAADVS